jgi:uncharacterized protein YkwD
MAIKDGDKKPQVSSDVSPVAIPIHPDGTSFGTAASDKISFHGSLPVMQRSGAAQAAVITTAPTNSSPYGFSQAQATSIIALLNEIRAAIVEKGFIKGA